MIILLAKIAIIVVLLRTNLMTGGFGCIPKGLTYAIPAIIVRLGFSAHEFLEQGALSGLLGITIYIAYVCAISIGFFYSEEKVGSTIFRFPLMIIGGGILLFLT